MSRRVFVTNWSSRKNEMVLIGLEWSLQEGTRISRGEQTLTQHQNTLHQVNLRPFTHVVSRFSGTSPLRRLCLPHQWVSFSFALQSFHSY